MEPEHYCEILRGLRVALKIQVPGARAESPNSPRAPRRSENPGSWSQSRIVKFSAGSISASVSKSRRLEQEHYRQILRGLRDALKIQESMRVSCLADILRTLVKNGGGSRSKIEAILVQNRSWQAKDVVKFLVLSLSLIHI